MVSVAKNECRYSVVTWFVASACFYCLISSFISSLSSYPLSSMVFFNVSILSK